MNWLLGRGPALVLMIITHSQNSHTPIIDPIILLSGVKCLVIVIYIILSMLVVKHVSLIQRTLVVLSPSVILRSTCLDGALVNIVEGIIFAEVIRSTETTVSAP